MKINAINTILIASVVWAMCATAQNPSPTEIANTVSNLWFSNNLTGLSVYATNLYSRADTNYLPIIMVALFHDRMFKGQLISASNKLAKVANQIANNPDGFPDKFKYHFSVISGMTFQSIGDIASEGGNPEAAVTEPQLIRDDMGIFMIPDIAILYATPAIVFP